MDRWLDKSLLGYTSIGYRYRRLEPVQVDLRGRHALVTGATSGLGEAAATALAKLGASVCIVGRSRQKTERVRQAIAQTSGNPRIRAELADLSQMRAVRDLAKRIARPLDILVNNAGVLLPSREETPNGIERTFATNLLGHFVLTEALKPLLISSGSARIVNVSSGGMYAERICVDDLEYRNETYDGVRAYARTKRGQVILTEHWAEELRRHGVVVHTMHPGWADTPGVELALPRFYRWTKPLLRTVEQGADTIVWLCASAEAGDKSGLFWHDRTPRPTHRFKGTKETPEERERFIRSLHEYAQRSIVRGTTHTSGDEVM